VDARPVLIEVARALGTHNLEAILIGNAIQGVKSFHVLRSRAGSFTIEGESVVIAALPDIIASKRAADRPRDRAVIDVLEQTLRQKENFPG